MANKYSESLAVLLNNGSKQVLPISKAQLIELANADKTKFTGYDVNNAKSVADALTYLLNKGNSDLEAAKTYTGSSINALNSTYTARTGYVLTGITENAGVLTAYTEEWLDASKVSYNGDSNVKSAIEAIQANLANLTGNGEGSVADQINDAIEALAYNTAGTANMPVVAVTQTDGVIAPVQGNIDAQYVNVDNSTLEWDLDNNDTVDTDITVQTAIEHLQDEINSAVGDAARYTISEVTESVPATVLHRYQLSQSINGGAATKAGEYIDIPKDSSLVNFFLGHTDDALSGADANGESDSSTVTNGTGADALVYVVQLANGKYKLASIDVSSFLKESEFSDGLQVNSGVVSVKRDSTSEAFLTVGSDGVKLSGVQSAIDTAYNNAKDYADGLIADLDSEVGAKYQAGDLAYVLTGVSQADGELSSYYAVALDDAHVKTTFAANNDPVAALVPANGTNPANVKEALDLIASSLSALTGTAPIDTITGDNDNAYVNVTATKTGSTVALTVDDSALGNVAKLQYDEVSSWSGEVADIFNPEVSGD